HPLRSPGGPGRIDRRADGGRDGVHLLTIAEAQLRRDAFALATAETSSVMSGAFGADPAGRCETSGSMRMRSIVSGSPTPALTISAASAAASGPENDVPSTVEATPCRLGGPTGTFAPGSAIAAHSLDQVTT